MSRRFLYPFGQCNVSNIEVFILSSFLSFSVAVKWKRNCLSQSLQVCDTLPSNKKCWEGSNLSITDKYKFYFTNVSINLSAVPVLEMLSVEVKYVPAAELNFYSDTMLYYPSLTNIR